MAKVRLPENKPSSQLTRSELQNRENVHFPEKTSYYPNADVMLGHRLRRWPNITAALGQRLVFAEL